MFPRASISIEPRSRRSDIFVALALAAIAFIVPLVLSLMAGD